MIVLALDAAKTTGFAFKGNDGWQWGTVKGHDQAKRIDLIKWAVESGCTHVALEQPYLGLNAKTYGDLMELRGMLRADATREGLLYVENDLRPSTWQRHMLVIGSKSCPKGMTKVWSREVAGRIVGYTFKEKEHDAADAVCIADCETQISRLEGLLEAGK